MATFRHQYRLLKGITRNWQHVNAGTRSISSKANRAGISTSRLAGVALATGAGGYLLYEMKQRWSEGQFNTGQVLPMPTLLAAEPQMQDTVITGNKNHACYLWIHLDPKADARACTRAVADIQAHVKALLGKDAEDEDEEILAGVAFGPHFYAKLGGKTGEDFNYSHRKGVHGDMPAAGGDIFIHTKSHSVSNLFDFTKRIVNSMPKGSVKKFEDIYSFVYRYGRDLSGFIDGTENPADDDHRTRVAVDPKTSGSYLITQKWIHDHNMIDTNKDATLEGWVGRGRPDSVEQKSKLVTSHVARMVGGTAVGQKKPFEIVRQSMPYGTVGGESGLFFIAYAASPRNFNYMLDRMVGRQDDRHNDDVMRLSKCVGSTYWYVPSKAELAKLK